MFEVLQEYNRLMWLVGAFVAVVLVALSVHYIVFAVLNHVMLVLE